MGSFHAAADRCPECGSEWRKPWRYTVGERRISWRWIGVGTGAVLSGMALQVVTLTLLFR
jgi:hypothetical protein